jgi:AraC family transcriptional regulator, regulatory protein of adaptative response / methylated-DNA-[protein]-cysteine methyltransferase
MNLSAETTINPCKDYVRIAKAIAFMRQNGDRQPSLGAIADHLHLSEYHFQRLFTQWAGISPKRFLQYLTLEYAKSQIARTKSLLDLSLEIGLSSPGRLHDLFVNLEAITPGEYKAGGAGLRIWYGIHETPFGLVLIAATARGICNLYFLGEAAEETAPQLLRQMWGKAELKRDQGRTKGLCDRIFPLTATRSEAPLTVIVKGTNFQIQVWKALLNLPFGTMTTYQTLAAAIQKPTAARAIGNAVGKNPIGYLIPCHRVIRESGELGGYRWGLDRKAALLGWEAGASAQD